MKKDVTNAGKNTDDYDVRKRMSLMQVRILMIMMYEKGLSLMQVRILMIIIYEKGCH